MGNSVSVEGTILLIVCDFALPVPPAGTFWTTLHKLGFIRYYFYTRIKTAAFPVSQEKQLGYLSAFLADKDISHLDIWLKGRQDDSLARIFPKLRKLYTGVGAYCPPSLISYDAVIVSYPDPLGIGWKELEKDILGKCKKRALIVNGRGRLLPLTPQIHRLLTWHRYLAVTRIIELVLGLVSIPLAAFLAMKDAFTGISCAQRGRDGLQ